MAEGILFKLFPKIHLLPRPSMENFSPKGSLVGKLPELMKTERHKGSLCGARAIVATGAHIVWEEGPHSIAPPFMSFLSSIWMSLGFGVVTNKKQLLYEYDVRHDTTSVAFCTLQLSSEWTYRTRRGKTSFQESWSTRPFIHPPIYSHAHSFARWFHEGLLTATMSVALWSKWGALG